MTAMQAPGNVAAKDIPHGISETAVDEYDSQAKLLQEFSKVPSIDKAWIFKSDCGVLTTCFMSFFFVHFEFLTIMLFIRLMFHLFNVYSIYLNLCLLTICYAFGFFIVF